MTQNDVVKFLEDQKLKKYFTEPKIKIGIFIRIKKLFNSFSLAKITLKISSRNT